MRTKKEVIKDYLGDNNPDTFDVTMGSSLVEDVMQLWGMEILQEMLNRSAHNPHLNENIVTLGALATEPFGNPFTLKTITE